MVISATSISQCWPSHVTSNSEVPALLSSSFQEKRFNVPVHLISELCLNCFRDFFKAGELNFTANIYISIFLRD